MGVANRARIKPGTIYLHLSGIGWWHKVGGPFFLETCSMSLVSYTLMFISFFFFVLLILYPCWFFLLSFLFVFRFIFSVSPTKVFQRGMRSAGVGVLGKMFSLVGGETASFPPTLAAVSKKSSSLISLVLLGGRCLEDQCLEDLCYCGGRSTLVLVLVGMNQEGSSAGPQYRGGGGKLVPPICGYQRTFS